MAIPSDGSFSNDPQSGGSQYSAPTGSYGASYGNGLPPLASTFTPIAQPALPQIPGGAPYSNGAISSAIGAGQDAATRAGYSAVPATNTATSGDTAAANSGAPGGAAGGGKDPFQGLLSALMPDPAIANRQLDQQQQMLDYMLKNYYPQQQQLQQQAAALQAQLAAAQQSGDWNGVATMQKQLQDNNTQLAMLNANLQSDQAISGITGQFGGAPTLQAQQLMNEDALTQGNQNLTARGQDVSYADVMAQLAGNVANNQTGYNQGLMGMAGSYGQDAVQMAQIQAQLAQSPLVAWYTARGLPPPQSAIQQAQAPNLGQDLATLQKYGMSPTSLSELTGQSKALQGLGQYQAPNLSWQFSQQAPPQLQQTGPALAKATPDQLQNAYSVWQNQLGPQSKWDPNVFAGYLNQTLGIPTAAGQSIAKQWGQAAPGGNGPGSGKAEVRNDPKAWANWVETAMQGYNQDAQNQTPLSFTQSAPNGYQGNVAQPPNLQFGGAGGPSGGAYQAQGNQFQNQFQMGTQQMRVAGENPGGGTMRAPQGGMPLGPPQFAGGAGGGMTTGMGMNEMGGGSPRGPLGGPPPAPGGDAELGPGMYRPPYDPTARGVGQLPVFASQQGGQPPASPMSQGAPPWAQALQGGQALPAYTAPGGVPLPSAQQWQTFNPGERQSLMQLQQMVNGIDPSSFQQMLAQSSPEWGMTSAARYQG